MSKKLMSHLVYGFPDIQSSQYLVERLTILGVEYLEIQIPFSDPLSDGPILSAANSIASEHANAADLFNYLEANFVAKITATKIIVMCYFQTIFSYGVKRFCIDVARSGVSGIIVPDLPFDQIDYKELLAQCANNHLMLVPVVSPNVPEIRLKQYLNTSTRLVYLTARTGTTGTHSTIEQISNINHVSKNIKVLAPFAELALGFGIQSSDDIKSLPDLIDIVVVGSAITQSITINGKAKTVAFVKKLLDACYET